MLHNSAFESAYRNDGRAALLNARFAHAGAIEVIKAAYAEIGNVAMVSSFGADSVVLLRLVAQVNRHAPVLFVDTEMLFAETLEYQARVASLLGLTNVQVIKAKDAELHDPSGTLHKSDPNACCSLRKTEPLQEALSSFDGWITGRKRHQSGTRARLNMFEAEDNSPRIKVNPLALWSAQDTQRFMQDTQLPRHPLVAKGYPSIGCAPCTTPVKEGEDPRAGRWRATEKEECGIHFVNGKMVRTGVNT
ncbi:MAG: phosphoadenylyl-sulfate reductase [Rhodobacteraceae bacterium]|jgi:phosphoadenosine phosphosulfate reductase|nr:phosphoadenylyl-sulfate reductase [Paracoccaceae bacterium]